MEKSPSWENNRLSASQEIPLIFVNQIFITAFTSACHLSPYQWNNPCLRHQFIFHNMKHFNGDELFKPHPNPKLEYHPLSAVRYCLFNIYTATLPIGDHSSIFNLRTCHNVLTGTDLSWLRCILWWIYYNQWLRRCIVSMHKKHYCLLSSWYISFLGSSGKITYHTSHLPLQILCFKSNTVAFMVKSYI